MLEHHNFGTIMYDNEKIAKHLSYEWAKNQDLYGMRVISNPVDEDTGNLFINDNDDMFLFLFIINN